MYMIYMVQYSPCRGNGATYIYMDICLQYTVYTLYYIFTYHHFIQIDVYILSLSLSLLFVSLYFYLYMYFNVISNPTFLKPRNCFVDSSKASWQLPKATSHVPSAVRQCPVTNKSRDRMGFGLCCYGVHHYCCHDPHHNELNHDAFGILHQKYLSCFIMIHVLSKVIIIFL